MRAAFVVGASATWVEESGYTVPPKAQPFHYLEGLWRGTADPRVRRRPLLLTFAGRAGRFFNEPAAVELIN